MIDKRKFHLYLNDLMEKNPRLESLIEAIQEKYDSTINPIQENERVALFQFPEQFLQRIELEDGHHTSRLHEFAENLVHELLKIPAIYLLHENSFGDSVIMSLVKAACGAYNNRVDYGFLRKLLSNDPCYDDKKVDEMTGQMSINKLSCLDQRDSSGFSPIDYLINFAYGLENFEGTEPDETLKKLLFDFSNGRLLIAQSQPEVSDLEMLMNQTHP